MNIVHILLALGLILIGLDLGLDVSGDVLVWIAVVAGFAAAALDVSDKSNNHRN